MNFSELAFKRSEVYRLLSYLVSYPYDEDIKDIWNRFNQLSSVIEFLKKKFGYNDYTDLLDKVIKFFKEYINKLGKDMFQAEYTSLFDLGTPEPPCPLYEYQYIEKQDEDIIVEYMGVYMDKEVYYLSKLQDFYRKYGVESNWSIERPDYIGVELEFMSHLCYIEAEKRVRNEDVISILNDEEFLIKKHLKKFIFSLEKCIKEKSSLEPYLKLYELINNYISEDERVINMLKNKVL